MYDLELLRKFCVVAKHCNFTKASEELFISQPALSKSIRQLENQLGVQLFKRNTKLVTLTNEGSILYNIISPKMDYLSNVDSILETLKSKNNSTLRIGCNSSLTRYLLVPVFKKFLSTHKNINISIKNDPTYSLVDLLKKKELDILIVNLPLQNINGLDITELKHVQDVFLAGEKYSYLKNQPVTFEQLQKLPLITYSKGSVTREHFDYCCMKNNISITPYIETARATLLVDFCVLGLGITFTTYEFVKKEIAENNLFILDVKPYIPKRSFGFATRNEPKSQILNEFISTVQNEINNL